MTYSPTIGIVAPLSGDSRRIGAEMRAAALMAVEEQNASQGILGAPVEAAIGDDRGDVEVGAAVARELCGRSALLGVVGNLNSDVSIAASNIYARAGVAMITPIASNPVLTERGLGNVFRFTNRDDVTGTAIAQYLHDALAKRFAVLVESDTAYGRSMTACFRDAFVALGGAVLRHETIASGTREFRPLLERLPRDFDLLFYGGMFEGAALLRALRRDGFEQLFAAGDGCWDTTAFLEPAGAAATAGEGVLVLSASPEIGRVPEARDFAARYAQRHGPITNYAVNSYDTTRLLLQAIEAATKITGRNLPSRSEVIDELHRVAFRGIAYADAVRWDANRDNGAVITALHQVEAGRFHEVAEFDRDNHLVFVREGVRR